MTREPSPRVSIFFGYVWATFAGIGMGLLPLAYGVYLPARQAFLWLRDGTWHPEPAVALLMGGSSEGWATNPTSWFGLWRALNWLHASAILVPFSFLGFAATIGFLGDVGKARSRLRESRQSADRFGV